METTNIIVKYELVIILDAFLGEDAKVEIMKSIGEGIAKAGGKVINSQVWLPKQRFSFSINRCNEGTYYLINFECETQGVEKILSQLKLNERILRYAIFQGK